RIDRKVLRGAATEPLHGPGQVVRRPEHEHRDRSPRNRGLNSGQRVSVPTSPVSTLISSASAFRTLPVSSTIHWTSGQHRGVPVHYPCPLHMNTSRLPKSPIPPVIPVRQRFDRSRVKDLAAATVAALAQVIPDPTLVRGKVVGLTAPSRGIRDIGPVLRLLTEALHSFGAIPNVRTAMGTH